MNSSLRFFLNPVRPVLCLLVLLNVLAPLPLKAGGAKALLDKGWAALVQDHDVEALQYFGQAYEVARQEHNTEETAAALLHMGICSYGVSYTQGLRYCYRAMEEYQKLEAVSPQKALEGRSKCLQLISTIHSRQGQYRKSIQLSKEAIAGFPSSHDSSGYLGLIYSSLGNAYAQLHIQDSSEYFQRKALAEWLSTHHTVYLPSAYFSMAHIALKKGQQQESLALFRRGRAIADSTGNRQSQVSALLGLGQWSLRFEKDDRIAEDYYQQARKIASDLSDRSFYLKTLQSLSDLEKQRGDFRKALLYQQEIGAIRDTLYSWEKQNTIKSLEIQFEVSEKDRQLKLIEKEKDIMRLTNLLLGGSIGFVILISAGVIIFLRRINKRDRQLLQTKEALVKAVEEQQQLKELQMQHELELKENQLSAMTLQMRQKNELMQELKESLDQHHELSRDQNLQKIIGKGQNQEKEWTDFNTHFESINKHFYTRLRQAYPEISPNDLRLCALIRLNLSSKEMAGILNISTESVKTARYRLRKKLQLNTEDNLTGFIMNL
jgi:DNA-binding CsgD family transcriptional regulator/tetratricopeptide (TPR) repeat protein